MEWIQGTFNGVQMAAFKQLYDGEALVQILHTLEPEYWPNPGTTPLKKKTSFTPSFKNADKKLLPVVNRTEKVKNFKYIVSHAEKYFKDRGEKSSIPSNFQG